MNKLIFKAVGVAAVATAFCVGCSEKPDDNGGGDVTETETTITDNRGGKSTTYRKVKIGTQTWMGKNLDYAANGSVCYENSADNCAKYGRLYDWNTAKTACPSGWHLPNDAEWTTLTDYVGGASTAGTRLKSTSGWNVDDDEEPVPAGTDDYNFSALPGGARFDDGDFDEVGNMGIWWSATEDDDGYDGTKYAWFRAMASLEVSVYRSGLPRLYLFSVRCVQD